MGITQHIGGPRPGELTAEEVTALVDFGQAPEGTTHWLLAIDRRGISAGWLQLGESGKMRLMAPAPGFNVPIVLGDGPSRQIVVRRPTGLIISTAAQIQRALLEEQAVKEAAEEMATAVAPAETPQHDEVWSCEKCGKMAFGIALRHSTKEILVICLLCGEKQEGIAIEFLVPENEDDVVGLEPPAGKPQ